MRLFLLPISTRRAFLYGHRSVTAATDKNPAAKAPLIERLTTRAARTWVDWEKRESGWQKTLTQYGNQALQRIPYEEWGLKSIPPLSSAAREKGEEIVPVIFPSSMIREDKVPNILKTLASERRDLHRKKMWWSFAIMPLTAPFMIIPIIPNIPFFYVAFRAYSHWRAYSGSEHLSFLLEKKLIKATPTSELDTVYPIDSSNPGFESSPSVPESTVLDLQEAKEVAEILQVPELAPELERAVTQVEQALSKEEEAAAAAAAAKSSPSTSEKKQQ